MPVIEHKHGIELSAGSSRQIQVVVREIPASIEEILAKLQREKEFEEAVSSLARVGADDLRDALSGKEPDLNNFLYNNLNSVDTLARRILKEGELIEKIYPEAYSELQTDPRRNITPREAKRMAWFLADSITSHAAMIAQNPPQAPDTN